MKKELTELVFILDRSGSMSGLEEDTIGGYNEMLRRQKQEPGEAIVTTVLFDDRYELLHDRIHIRGIRPITEDDYFVRGSTALLDAVGRTIDKIGNVQKHTADEERAGKVLFVITTDGMENASREYTLTRVRHMIERQKSRYGWEFLFLGANIDAVAAARDFGIPADRAADYNADGEGTRLNYMTVSNTICNFRMNSEINPDWKDEIDRDFRERGKKKQR